jgi:hypothetical protein
MCTSTKTHNIAVAYLEKTNQSVNDYCGNCGELVDDIMHWIGEDNVRIMYIEGGKWLMCGNLKWDWHMVAVIDGLVHDAWFPNLILSPLDYIKQAFPGAKVDFSFPAEVIQES